MHEIQEQVISLFFNGKHSCLQKRTICRRLNISIYELDMIIKAYYDEQSAKDIDSLMWTRTHPNSCTLPKKQSFIDSIVQREHEKHVRQRLKEKSCFDGGVAV